jgi:hypothetical protein
MGQREALKLSTEHLLKRVQRIKMKYPKHSWAEDPLTAEAVRGVKRKPSS